jgi:multidrug efflux pump subunit AcrB
MSDLPSVVDRSEIAPEAEHWTGRHGKPIIFVILTLVVAGAFMAFNIPISVFPSTDFPAHRGGIDNGVAPINQMQVTVTKPIEEAVNSVPGLESVSITSRGSAEINLFFNWSVDMFQTLGVRQRGAGARAIHAAATRTKLYANRLTFAAFPILGYSLTSEHSADASVGTGQLYDQAAAESRERRLDGGVQGGRCPNFRSSRIPAKLLRRR